jgi:thymidylate kinase
MIETRRKFLTAFFAALEANGVRYCVMRNYDDLYANDSTDVDMIVSAYSLDRFRRCLRESADSTGFYFVHAARYVNYSQVFWHPIAGFVRIDFETEVRWRLFTVLTARETLDGRQRHQEFFIPHPEHESVILFVAAIWRGELSERYRRQLILLYSRCPDRESLRRTLADAFGGVGNLLADLQGQVEMRVVDSKFWRRLRWHLVLRSHLSWARGLKLAHNTWTDVLRVLERMRQPAGMSLLYVSSHPQQRAFDDLMRRIHFLFPEKKCVIQAFDLTNENIPVVSWTWRMRWLRIRTMFKGGLFMRAYRVARDEELPRIARMHARFLYSDRTFICVEDSLGRNYFAHVSSGFMSTTAEGRQPDANFSKRFIEFTSDILKRASLPLATARPKRGLFCVLVGLDGSGKTTLARNLCDVSFAGERFRGVRYFHWRPKIFKTIEFPLPEFRNTPRKTLLAPTQINAALSLARIIKNALLVNLAWHWRVASWIDQGYLVLVDRYFYNYFLDPVSVKYSGPAWLLRLAQKWFPPPDVTIVLRAPQEILLRRKQELTAEEILRQASVLETIRFDSSRIIKADASLAAHEVASRTMNALVEAAVEN